jgi:hypothetical protein
MPEGSMRFRWFSLGVLTFCMMAGSPAWGNLIITPTFDSTITSDPNRAAIEGVINSAIQAYATTYTNPIDVTIDFKEGGGLGTSLTTVYKLSY